MSALASSNLHSVAVKKLGQPTIDDAVWDRALRLLRARVGAGKEMTQKGLADRIGVKPPSVSGWFNRKQKPTVPNLIDALRAIGEDPVRVLPELFRADQIAVSDLHARLVNMSEFLALDPEVVMLAWDQDQSTLGGDWLDVWRGLPDYVRQAAMAAVYLWGHPIEAACKAAREAWESSDDEDRAKAGQDPWNWLDRLRWKLPERKSSGTRPSVRVGNLKANG